MLLRDYEVVDENALTVASISVVERLNTDSRSTLSTSEGKRISLPLIFTILSGYILLSGTIVAYDRHLENARSVSVTTLDL